AHSEYVIQIKIIKGAFLIKNFCETIKQTAYKLENKQKYSRFLLNMQSLRNSILNHVRVRVFTTKRLIAGELSALYGDCQQLRTCSTISSNSNDQVMDRVIKLVKKFDKIDAAKVTEKADFQKDLSLDSLDRVELVMAFEEEFSVEIPDAEADKLKCCADVAKYVISTADQKI
ncbi:acyl carrier 3, mitochondrial, partial [Olea europaea subsp. europaea]